MQNLMNLDELPPQVKERFVPYLRELIELHGDKIICVSIYGSAAGRNYIHKVSDINSVVVFQDLDFSIFKKSLKVVSRGLKSKITPPLFLTKKYIESSWDVFPIEFLDMKENHVLIYGEDILTTLEINSRDLRLFCEQELKGKLIRIRQAYLEIGLNKRHIKTILRESLDSLMPVFRNLIRLKNKKPHVDKEKILYELAEEFHLNVDVFIPIYHDKAHKKKIAHTDTEALLEKYIAELQRLSFLVDEL